MTNKFTVLVGSVLVCLLLTLGTGCPAGGGGFVSDENGGGMTGGGGGMQTTFTASDPSPQPMTLSMAQGTAGTQTFQVRVLVTDLGAFFGAAFRVVFDESTARFDGLDATGSFIEGSGIATDIRAVLDPADSGVVLVNATRQGQFAGVDAAGSQLLVTLNFTAIGVTSGNAFGFDTASTRGVTTCPAPPAACTNVADTALTWSGGTLTSN